MKKRWVWIKQRTGKKLSWMSSSVFVSMVVDFISVVTMPSRYHLQRLVHNENNCRRVFLEIWDKYQQQAAPHDTFATSLKPQISILAHADKRSGDSLVSGAATGLAVITTKHYNDNEIKYSIILQVVDSGMTKSSVHFSMSAFKKILLIFHSPCWIDLHYWNLNSPDNEWIKFHPKRSSFVAWILNYLYEITITLFLNVRNVN